MTTAEGLPYEPATSEPPAYERMRAGVYANSLIQRNLMLEINSEGYVNGATQQMLRDNHERTGNIEEVLLPGSALDIFRYGLTYDTEPNPGFSVLLRVRNALRCAAELERAEATGRRLDDIFYRNGQAWYASGLRLINPRSARFAPDFDGIEPVSLIDSLISGNIKHVFGERSTVIGFLENYCKDKLGVQAQVPDTEPFWPTDFPPNLTQPRYRAPNGERFAYFMYEAMHEAKHASAPKRIQGPYYHDFVDRLQHISTQLAEIDPRLGPKHLHAKSYRPRDMAIEMVPNITPGQVHAFELLYKQKNDYLYEVSAKHWEKDKDAVIEPDILTTSPYIRQSDPTACVAACFRMAFAGVTGDRLNEEEVTQTILNVYRLSHVDQAELLKIFSTDYFKRAYSQETTALEFVGMDLVSIRKIAEGMKRKQPGCQIYCVLNLESDTSSDRNIWHSVLLGSVSAESIVCHDPAADPKSGAPNRILEKQKFLKRWAATFNAGYLVISKPAD